SQELLVKDVELQTDGGKKVTALKPAKNGLPAYHADGWLTNMPPWNYAAFERNLKATLPGNSARTSVRVLASTQSAHLTTGSRWLHQAFFWVHAPEATELRFRFPGPVSGLGAWIDGSARFGHLTPERAVAEFVLPVPGDSKPRLVE